MIDQKKKNKNKRKKKKKKNRQKRKILAITAPERCNNGEAHDIEQQLRRTSTSTLHLCPWCDTMDGDGPSFLLFLVGIIPCTTLSAVNRLLVHHGTAVNGLLHLLSDYTCSKNLPLNNRHSLVRFLFCTNIPTLQAQRMLDYSVQAPLT